MRLKGLRGQPLLEPPPREEELWWRMTPKDLKAIRNAVGEARRSTIEGALELVYYLKVLGWEEEVTAGDRRMIEAHLKELREKREGTGLAKMHHWMRGLGLKGRTPKGDEEITRETLGRLDAGIVSVIPELL